MMMNLSELGNLHADIQAVHEMVQVLKAIIDGKVIKINILRNETGHFFYELSHYYKDADNTDPYVSSENRFSSVEEAARGALRRATMFYRSTDEGGSWVRNEAFNP
jgi:hypothetical protein